VIFNQASVRVYSKFRDHEQGNSLSSGRSPINTGQNQMDNILYIFVIPARDKYFLSAYLVMSILGRASLGSDIGKGTPGLWLGQAHGTAPLPCQHFGDIGIL